MDDIQVSSDEMSMLAHEINEEHHLFERSMSDGFAHALRAGELLLKAKGSLKHGSFQAWIKANCRIGIRMAENYMKLFEKRELLSKAKSSAYLSDGEFTMKHALRVIEIEEGMSILKEHEAIEKEEKRKEKYHEFERSVQEYLIKAKSFKECIKIGEEAFEIGKFTPEAMKFTINRNKLIIGSLIEFNKLLGDDEE